MKFELYEKCSKCKEYQKKKCKGYKFSIKILNLSCKKFEENKK